MIRFTKMSITILTALSCAVGSCASAGPESFPDASVEVRLMDHHDALTEALARTFSWADQVEIAASVSDLVATDTLWYPVRMLRRSFDEAARLASSLENTPLPGTGAAAAERTARMNAFLDEVGAHVRVTESVVENPDIDGPALVREADAIKVAVDMAAIEHAGLLAFVTDPRFEFREFTWLRPRHQVAINYAAMLDQLDRMLADDGPDWFRRWEHSSDWLREALASARKALDEIELSIPASEQDSLSARLGELRTEDRLVGERLFAVRTELAKPAPDLRMARRELEGARDAVNAAETVYRKLLAAGDAVPYPEYDFSEFRLPVI